MRMTMSALVRLTGVWIAVVTSAVAPAWSAAPVVWIVAPADGAAIAVGEEIAVEVAVDGLVGNSPVSLRVDGRSVGVTSDRPYVFAVDTSDWTAGEHVLEAVVYLEEGEARSEPVRVRVRGREGPAAVRRRSGGGGKVVALADDFRDGYLDPSVWSAVNPDPGLRVREWAAELRISGTTMAEQWVETGIATVGFPKQDIEAGVDFQARQVGAAGERVVYLKLFDPESGQAFGVFFHPEQGYNVEIASPWTLGTYAEPVGDELSAAWHRLAISYDADAGVARGFADGKLIGSFEVEVERLALGLAFAADRPGIAVDVRFDNVELRTEGVVDEPGPEAAAEQVRERPTEEPAEPLVPGQIVHRQTRHGEYFEYVPVNLKEPIKVAVTVHGSEGDHVMTPALTRDIARKDIEQWGWLLLAEERGLIVVSPVFDGVRFWNYRLLWGSALGADEFLLEIIDGYARHFPNYDGRFYLFGHSAGGQFAQRFLVTHPERVIAAGISSAGAYAFPDDTVEWPFGRRNSPNPQGFAQAAALPVTVIVGSFDVEDKSGVGPSEYGATRIERGQNWVEAMQALAVANGLEPGVEFVLISSVGHRSPYLPIEGVARFFQAVEPEVGF